MEYFVIEAQFIDGNSCVVAVKQDREVAQKVVKAYKARDKQEPGLTESYSIIHVVDSPDPFQISAWTDIVSL